MLPRARKWIAFGIVVFGSYLIFQDLQSSWAAFLADCPNRDVLSWDANLRFRTVVDLYEEIREGDFWLPIYYALWSPTWPALRSFFALALFFANGIGPDTTQDVAISFCFYILLFPSLLWIGVDLCRDAFRGALVWFFSSLLLLYSRQFTVYALSSMLETQGMFFMLWSLYFIYKSYEQERMRRFLKEGTMQTYFPIKRRWFWGLFIFGQGLFHTKYPYGLMLWIAIAAYEFFREPLRFFSFLDILLRRRYQGRRRVLLHALGVVALLFVLLVVLSRFSLPWLPASALRSKTVRNLIWLTSLIFFIDINIYIYRNRKELSQFFDSAFQTLYVGFLAPVAFWLLLHPDRLGSILGTQQHRQEAGRSFAMSLVLDVCSNTPSHCIWRLWDPFLGSCCIFGCSGVSSPGGVGLPQPSVIRWFLCSPFF